jgi:hypothetical protein
MCVVEFAVLPVRARLNHVLISYIQQVSLQTCCLMKQMNQVVLQYMTHRCSYEIVVLLFKLTNLMSFETGQPSGAEGPDTQL